MPQGERPTGDRASSGQRADGAQKWTRDSGAAIFSENSGAEKTVTGKVKSIVGNEVVLIVTHTSGAENKGGGIKNSADTAATDLPGSASAAQQSGQKPETESTGPADASERAGAGQETTATYLIPVGMAIGNKDFSAIKAGNTLRIYFGTDPNDGSEIITAVELR